MSSSNLIVSPELAAKAKEADEAALRAFHQRIEALVGRYTIKEAARIIGVSTGHLRELSLRHGFHFLAPAERTKADRRKIRKVFEDARLNRTVRQVEPVRSLLPGQLSVTPRQELEGRKLLVVRQNAFYKRVLELSEVFSLHETAERVQVSVRFLKNFAYDWDIEFAGEERPYSVSKAAREDELDAADLPDSYDDFGFFNRSKQSSQRLQSH